MNQMFLTFALGNAVQVRVRDDTDDRTEVQQVIARPAPLNRKLFD